MVSSYQSQVTLTKLFNSSSARAMFTKFEELDKKNTL